MRRMLCCPPESGDMEGSQARYKIYNIGGGQSDLLYFIETLENALSKKAIKEFYPMQPGDVYKTFADTEALENDFGMIPKVRIEDGLRHFIQWYNEYYCISL